MKNLIVMIIMVMTLSCSMKYGILDKSSFTNGEIICLDIHEKEKCFLLQELSKEQLRALQIYMEIQQLQLRLTELGEELEKMTPPKEQGEIKLL